MERVAGHRDEANVLAQLGDAIRASRRVAGMSQEAFADAAGIDRSHMGKIERGERNLTLLNFHRIAMALNMPASELLRQASL
ncbi:helix-turn-helix domain-containing protein [Sphingomonas sp. Leaf4]|uniref:helix-turn-helix domain-containing protein n=1 Tax=Sphingomonas sp. Leaf4 TaxID=2876553 RepID=UPI0022A76D5F|nr:helix-turn-helix transcriptional regulator [Sphingomonas sp. Leaf4]